MTFDLAVISLSDRGVQVTLEDGSPAFWLPRAHVEWRGLLEPGEMVTADIPRWVVAKHRQLQHVRGQYAFPLTPLPGLDPAKSQGAFPMANDTPRGALFRVPEADKKNDKWPDYRGDLTIDGVKWKLAGWVKTDKNGGKYLSLVAKLPDENPAERQQRQPDRSGPDFDSQIPF